MVIKKFSGKYRFLSNFYPSRTLSPTLEHHFQAAKTDDPKLKEKILGAESAGQAKRLGRKAELPGNWDLVKDGVMLVLVRAKFLDPQLKRMLLGTGADRLVEGNDWHDNYWGACSCPACADEEGRNQLGHTLERVREELRSRG